MQKRIWQVASILQPAKFPFAYYMLCKLSYRFFGPKMTSFDKIDQSAKVKFLFVIRNHVDFENDALFLFIRARVCTGKIPGNSRIFNTAHHPTCAPLVETDRSRKVPRKSGVGTFRQTSDNF